MLNRGGVVDGTASVSFSSGLLQSAGGTAGAPVANRFGTLSLSASASIFLADHAAVTFTSGSWITGQGLTLNLQNTTGLWSTSTSPTLSDTYVRFTSATGLNAARLTEVAFTGFEKGATLVPQTVGATNYWFLAPTGAPLIEWRGAAHTGIDTDRPLEHRHQLGRRRGTQRRRPDRRRARPRRPAVVQCGHRRCAGHVGQAADREQMPPRRSTCARKAEPSRSTTPATARACRFHRRQQHRDFRRTGPAASDPLALQHAGKQVLTLSGKVSGSGGIVSDYAGPGTTGNFDAGIIRLAGDVGTSDYTGGFWVKGAPGNNPALDRGARELRIAADGSLFGAGSFHRRCGHQHAGAAHRRRHDGLVPASSPRAVRTPWTPRCASTATCSTTPWVGSPSAAPTRAT
jgi:hypothetical protein